MEEIPSATGPDTSARAEAANPWQIRVRKAVGTKWRDIIEALKTDKVRLWLVYTVAMSLSPIWAQPLIAWTVRSSVTLSGIISHGELIIIAVALSADAVGTMATGRQGNRDGTGLVIGLTVLLILSASFVFAAIASQAALGKGTDSTFVNGFSLVVFILSVFIGAGAKFAEHSRRQ